MKEPKQQLVMTTSSINPRHNTANLMRYYKREESVALN